MKKKGKLKIFIIFVTLVALAALIISLLFHYNSLKSKPKTFFVSSIDWLFEKINIQNDLHSFLGSVNLKTNLKSDNKTIGDTLNILNNTNIGFKAGIDYNTNEIHTSLVSNYNEEQLLNSNTCIDQNGIYINTKDIYNKTILIPINKYNHLVMSLFDQNNIRIILQSIKTAIDKSLQDKYFVQKNTIINLNGKDVKVTKNTLTLNNQNLKKIISSIKQDLINDDKFLNSLSSMLNKNTEEIKEEISSINDDLTEEIITISLYTKDNKIIGFEIAKTSTESLLILKESETNYSYELKSHINSYKGNIKIKNDSNNINLEIFINTDKVNGSIDIDITSIKDIDIDEFEKNDIIKIEDITDQERVEIFDNLQKTPSIRNLINDLWNLFEI